MRALVALETGSSHGLQQRLFPIGSFGVVKVLHKTTNAYCLCHPLARVNYSSYAVSSPTKIQTHIEKFSQHRGVQSQQLSQFPIQQQCNSNRNKCSFPKETSPRPSTFAPGPLGLRPGNLTPNPAQNQEARLSHLPLT